jgi:hypothetical protein
MRIWEFEGELAVNNRLPRIVGFALVCSSGLMLPFAASADENGGWYAGAELGFVLGSSQNLNSSGNTLTNDYNTGFAGGINGGYLFNNGLRPELAFDHGGSNISSIKQATPSTTTSQSSNVSGTVSANTVMANLWWDYRQSDGFFATVHPYIGAGLGAANVSINNEHLNSTGNAGFIAQGNITSGSATTFAYQIGFGAGIGLTPALWASLDFRYLATTNFSVPNDTGIGESKFSGTYHTPELFLGLKYHFGANGDS